MNAKYIIKPNVDTTKWAFIEGKVSKKSCTKVENKRLFGIQITTDDIFEKMPFMVPEYLNGSGRKMFCLYCEKQNISGVWFSREFNEEFQPIITDCNKFWMKFNEK